MEPEGKPNGSILVRAGYLRVARSKGRWKRAWPRSHLLQGHYETAPHNNPGFRGVNKDKFNIHAIPLSFTPY